jgi:nucleoside-triphosphatase THEP1
MSDFNKLILWTGGKHCGKTTRAAEFVHAARNVGFHVAGLLAFSVYDGQKLIGFDVFDVQSKTRVPLARRRDEGDRFAFAQEGFAFGACVLASQAAQSADLVIVDEFGPLELSGKGWRESVDRLLTLSDALILLVVRQELIRRVQQLYANVPTQQVAALKQGSIDTVVNLLRVRRQVSGAAR